jgi:hypothetical protein
MAVALPLLSPEEPLSSAILCFAAENGMDAAMVPLPGISAPVSYGAPVEVNVYLRALEGVRAGKATSRQQVYNQRIRGTTHVSPPGTAGPGKYATSSGGSAATAANRAPRVPSILARMKSVAGEDAIVAPMTPSPVKYGQATTKFSPSQTVKTPEATPAGGAGTSSSATKAHQHQQLIRIPTPKVTSKDRLPAELHGIKTEPVEVPIYLPLPSTSAARPPASTTTTNENEHHLAPATTTKKAHFGPAAAEAPSFADTHSRPIHVTVNLPKEAFPPPQPPAPAPAMPQAAQRLNNNSGIPPHSVVVPIHFSTKAPSSAGSSGSKKTKESSSSSSSSSNKRKPTAAAQQEIVVPIVLQGGSSAAAAAGSRRKERKSERSEVSAPQQQRYTGRASEEVAGGNET